ncbi:excalibur calcium-binding domain-containing protein [Aliiroseovarius crassostreae]|uniref:excalibur calcium-binding domain-containing protein n=1 Tax=Aliiroseovarius crassostreae TaxID=154981 RepID=UPI0021FF5316|nr:excalibur calcium-binding domain-containing protein [Aliiroseovarius crassostreae]UWP99376.1 excalibur calcium-binding domain-containing protein [Aliiroseovarius crassostreae]
MLQASRLLILLLFTTSCAASISSQASYFENLSTSELWQLQAVPSTPDKVMLVEAILASRGEYSRGRYTYLGSSTAFRVGNSVHRRNKENTLDKNCSDFETSAAAQLFFIKNGGPTRDPAGLDRDGDGFACEWGTVIKQNRTKSLKKTVSRTYYQPRCYVGPRGGRYTISASGRKNYGGC